MAVLETSMTSKARENGKKTPKTEKKTVKKVLLVAQELKLARVLAGNNKTARDRAVKSLKKWFQSRATTIPFTEEDFLRLWKGLFYSMWMSDKPLVQEECAENISNLVHALPVDTSVLFFKCGITILINEWMGIDQLRLDKFLMFVRRLLRQSLFVLKNQHWTRDSIRKFTEALSDTVLDTESRKPLGLLMHFIEIYLEELAKVSGGDLPPHLLTELVAPFIRQLAFTDDSRIIDHIRKHVFIYLIRQSDLGLDYEEKYKAWRKLGFPGSIDSMQKVEVSDNDDEVEDEEEADIRNRVLDPRAGRVDVELPQLKFHPKAMAKALSEHKFVKLTNSRSRRCLAELSEHFKKMASGIYPLGVKRVKLANDTYDTSIKKAVSRLLKFEKKIKGMKPKKRKHQKDDEIELRGGKKIKLNEKFREKIANELNHRNVIQEEVVGEGKKKRKRKSTEIPETPPQKQTKAEDVEESPLMELESIFKRNSGTWFVSKVCRGGESDVVEASFLNNDDQSQQLVERKGGSGRSLRKEEEEGGSLFPKNHQWEGEEEDDDGGFVEKILFPRRVSDVTTAEDKGGMGGVKKRAGLVENPFVMADSVPLKKVKINTNLNRSQEIDEHQAQIKSSPAIPYDASKKPSKPLLKASTMRSPINPFYSM